MNAPTIGIKAVTPMRVPDIAAYGSFSSFIILTVSPAQALIFLIFLVILQQAEGNIIYPKVVGTSVGLPSLWTLAAVTIGGGLFGVVGMLLGVPMAGTLYKLSFTVLEKKESELGITAEAVSEAPAKKSAKSAKSSKTTKAAKTAKHKK